VSEQFPCARCGSHLEYEPGTTALKCVNCGFEQPIRRSGERVEESDLGTAIASFAEQPTLEVITVRCGSCGAESSLPPNVDASRCPFCGTAVVALQSSKKALKPRSLLPFKFSRDRALARFRAWVSSLWFAPSRLKTDAGAGRLDGVYIPHWTFYADTSSSYRGERGDDHTEMETYQTDDGQTLTRTVTRTRWQAVSGNVSSHFDDVLVLASQSLPENQARDLAPWDLQNLVPYDDGFVSGFRVESYQIDIAAGFSRAQGLMAEEIVDVVRKDIGGDHQRVHSVETSYSSTTFKYILLPVWISSYRYGDRIFRFLVNGRTGEVQGERPWSWLKVGLAVAGAALLLALIAWLMSR